DLVDVDRRREARRNPETRPGLAHEIDGVEHVADVQRADAHIGQTAGSEVADTELAGHVQSPVSPDDDTSNPMSICDVSAGDAAPCAASTSANRAAPHLVEFDRF